jgi:hypothetical protein
LAGLVPADGPAKTQHRETLAETSCVSGNGQLAAATALPVSLRLCEKIDTNLSTHSGLEHKGQLRG